VFILDRVKYSSCDSQAKIPVDSNARCFTCFGSGSSTHKARLVAGGNWTLNDKEDIYSGFFCMDTVRIGFFRRALRTLMFCM
jgi:hypothetical protein